MTVSTVVKPLLVALQAGGGDPTLAGVRPLPAALLRRARLQSQLQRARGEEAFATGAVERATSLHLPARVRGAWSVERGAQQTFQECQLQNVLSLLSSYITERSQPP